LLFCYGYTLFSSTVSSVCDEGLGLIAFDLSFKLHSYVDTDTALYNTDLLCSVGVFSERTCGEYTCILNIRMFICSNDNKTNDSNKLSSERDNSRTVAPKLITITQ